MDSVLFSGVELPWWGYLTAALVFDPPRPQSLLARADKVIK